MENVIIQVYTVMRYFDLGLRAAGAYHCGDQIGTQERYDGEKKAADGAVEVGVARGAEAGVEVEAGGTDGSDGNAAVTKSGEQEKERGNGML